MATIQDVRGREILDSRGNPTVEVTLTLSDGTRAVAAVPSGASTGTFEAHELRDNDPNRYGGQGVLEAVRHVNGELREALVGKETVAQAEIDQAMKALDGTENKARLGANALLGISLAVARAEAQSSGVPLYVSLAQKMALAPTTKHFPVPMFNILNGGKHSDSGLSAQEFKIIPAGIAAYPDQLRAGSEIFHALKKILESRGYAVGVGDEGGFAPHLESHTQALELIHEAIAEAGYTAGKQIFLGLDVAANSFYEASEDLYHMKPEGKSLTRESLVSLYREWMGKFNLVSIEDGLHEEDWDGWNGMRAKLEKEPAAWGGKVLLIGDDLLVTNVKRVEKAIEKEACNAVLIKPNQIGTVTETLDCIRLAQAHGLKTVISHRSGETVDDFIADLAVGTGSQFIKTGSLSRGERLAKYNRLLAIYGELNS